LARFKDRYNFFTGKLRVAPRPFVPPHWAVPEDAPSATRFWVHVESGATAVRSGGDGWLFSEALQQWHQRQCGRVWLGYRLVRLHGFEEAERRIKDLQTEVGQKVRTANAYLDLLVSIAYEANRLTRRAERAHRALVSTTREVIRIASFLGRNADDLDPAGMAAVERARAAARSLQALAEDLKQTVSPIDRRFEAWAAPSAERHTRDKDVYEWVRYTTPSRNYREPDLQWLLASALVTFLQDNPGVSNEIACQRVSGYLRKIEAPLGRLRQDAA